MGMETNGPKESRSGGAFGEGWDRGLGDARPVGPVRSPKESPAIRRPRGEGVAEVGLWLDSLSHLSLVMDAPSFDEAIAADSTQ